jgi:hypothetical protein
MANPRITPEYEGIAAPSDYATFIIDNSTIVYDATKANGAATTMIGKAVTFSADRTIQLVGDGEFVLGKLIKVEADNRATVQVGGFMTLPGGTSATLTRGKAIVGDLLVSAEGYIREVATATAAELGVCRGFIVDDDATDPIVRL